MATRTPNDAPDGYTQPEWDAMRERGAIGMVDLPDGRFLDLVPLTRGIYRVCLGQPDHDGVYADEWHYQGHFEADVCMCAWDGIGEPGGWFRHPATGRRRPDGDPEREYIRE